MNKTYIYALIDPRDNAVRYIGKANNPKRRLTYHLLPSGLKFRTHKNHWLKLLQDLSIKPIIKIIEKINIKNWQAREKYWIEKYKNKYKLTNGTNGGDGLLGYKPSKETIEKIRKGNLGNIPWIKGKHHSKKVKKAQSKKMIGNNLFLGRTHTNETKLKISKSSPNRSGNRNTFYGKKHSKETRRKMKLAWKTRKLKNAIAK